MTCRSRITTPALLLVLISVSSASAHYLWVTLSAKGGKFGSTNIYFEGGPSAGDGQYLDHFKESKKTWIRTLEAPKPKLIETTDTKAQGKRWLTAELTGKSPRSIDCYAKFGVYRYGKTDVQLHYYARNLDVSDHEHLHELGRAEHLALDIVPHDIQGKMEATVFWKGKPQPGTLVYIRGPKGFQENVKTNDKGVAAFQPKAKGRYLLRTMVVEKDKSGTDQGKAYSEVRHHGTMIINLPL